MEEGCRADGDWQYSGLCTRHDGQAKTLTGMTRQDLGWRQRGKMLEGWERAAKWAPGVARRTWTWTWTWMWWYLGGSVNVVCDL